MKQHYLCFDCSKISEVNQKPDICPFCKSTKGRMMTDEEFNRQYDRGVIKLIDPSTGKPMK